MGQVLAILVMVLGLALVAALLTVQEWRWATAQDLKEKERAKVQPWQLESRLAQEESLRRLADSGHQDEQ